MKIPKKFYNVNDPEYPVVARNVGELKKALSELPDDLPLETSCSEYGADLIVYNISSMHPFLELRERETLN